MEIIQLAKILESHALFRDISHESLRQLLEGHSFKNLKHHETLFVAGQEASQFAVVLMGAFKLVRHTPQAGDAIMYFATPGDVIGGLVMLKAGARFPVSAISLGPSTVLLLPRATYRNAWMQNSSVQAKLNSLLYTRMSVLQDEKANAKLNLQQRIAVLLMKLLDQSPETDKLKLSIPLTRQEIADSVGATVEAVIRSMSEMSQKGIIRTESRQIEILRPDKIAEIVRAI